MTEQTHFTKQLNFSGTDQVSVLNKPFTSSSIWTVCWDSDLMTTLFFMVKHPNWRLLKFPPEKNSTSVQLKFIFVLVFITSQVNKVIRWRISWTLAPSFQDETFSDRMTKFLFSVIHTGSFKLLFFYSEIILNIHNKMRLNRDPKSTELQKITESTESALY